ncbi:hypothetical protein BEP19_06615 [Ammoniphilus oxalaticus]|uniref:SAM-dependent methyltransferase n=1 Tax=Ammoniphilus oxalaticus TaxID=66863 RepID=A0A419SJC2_9BACL|nr:SAM-dependent methyltransferase [Ammoniphilus oxalaticus]RKD24077.1 hypothetical protein BEP19_06615 [Ammoniphilus oxalaticus]
MSLKQIIQQQIESQNGQTISFYDFMELALYHPQQGYYSQARQKIGKEGDFYTSVSVGTIFGEVLARTLAEMAEQLTGNENCYLIEFGGGSGALAQQILREWKQRFPQLLSRVEMIMIEKSPYHRELQQESLEGFKARWFNDWEAARKQLGEMNAVVYSNELLDAFPVYILEYNGTDWQEVRVTWDGEKDQFVEVLVNIGSDQLKSYLQREKPYIPKIAGYRIEVNLDAENWLRQIGQGLKQGYLLTIDYGYEREELYRPQRKDGTLMCYYQHQVSTDPLADPGNKDITTHIHFSALMELGAQIGVENLGLLRQRQFLINGGILNMLQDHQAGDLYYDAVAKRNRAIRQLIMPGGMGDTFQALVQAKGEVKRDLESLKPKGWM